MRIGILFGRSIFREIKEARCARFTVIRARWRIFDADGIELGFESLAASWIYFHVEKSCSRFWVQVNLHESWFSLFLFLEYLLLSGSAVCFRYFLQVLYGWKAYNWKQYIIMILKIFIPYIHLSRKYKDNKLRNIYIYSRKQKHHVSSISVDILWTNTKKKKKKNREED